MAMNSLIISIGSNTSDRDVQMQNALKWLSETFEIVAFSGIYETEEFHGRYAPYLNCVVKALSDSMNVNEITSLMKGREREQGRTEESKLSGKIPMDIDLVMFDDTVLRPAELQRDYFTIGFHRMQHADLN